MQSLMELQEEYKQIIQKDLEAHGISAQNIKSYIENSTAKYHGRCVRTLYMPKLFREQDVHLFEELIKTLYGIFYKVMDQYAREEEYRKLFGFDERLEQLILREPTYDSPIPIARIDIFYHEDTGKFYFCEFNTDGSSAMNEDRELNKAILTTKAFQEFTEKYQVKTFELFDSFVKEFLDIYNSFCQKQPQGAFPETPHVAIVDFMESATNEEFKIFSQSFEKFGMTAEICEIRELKFQQGRLISPSGKKIDAIYRRAVTSDIMRHYEEVTAFLEAVREEKVCLIGEFRTQIPHNKILYKILHDKRTHQFLTQKEVEYIKEHIPYTVSLVQGMFDYDKVIQHKNEYIIKPEDSYGSKGIHAGVECNDQEWKKFVDECMDKDYILQQFCLPYESSNIDLVQDPKAEFRNYSNLTGLFVYNGKFCGCYSRISQSEIISTQYSEMALPTVIVENP